MSSLRTVTTAPSIKTVANPFWFNRARTLRYQVVNYFRPSSSLLDAVFAVFYIYRYNTSMS